MNQKNLIKLQIKYTSTYALERMHRYQVFTVHSIYRKTINLQADGNLLAIQAESSPLSPVSLITNLTQEQMQQLPVHEGQLVFITTGRLIFCKGNESPSPVFAFHYDEAEVSDLLLPAFYFTDEAFGNSDNGTLLRLKSLIKALIIKANTKGMDLVFSDSPLLKDNLMMSAAKMRIDTSAGLISLGKYQEAAAELIRLIGLGIGLTPSGDDFTSGVLAGLILFRLTEHPFADFYKKEVISHLYDTNDVSRTFLTAALDGHFSNAINSLGRIKKEDLDENILQTENLLLEKFLAIGHSSGIDALCGIYFVLLYLYSTS